jgi:S-DNA-T family DNA segregation ATPase FtsK/SpoIIIE
VKLKITLDRAQGQADLVVTAAADTTVGDVATALAERDPAHRGPSGPAGSPDDIGARAVTLTVLDGQRVTLDPGLPLADSGIRSAARVAVSAAGDRYVDHAARPVAQLTVLQGPDAGQRVPLPAGNQTIGRGAGCALRLTDTLVSRRHMRVFLAPGSAEILDLGSANGITLNDEPVARGAWLPGDRLRIGDTVLGIELATAPTAGAAGAAGAGGHAAHAGSEAFNRSPVITASYPGQSLEAPELPEAEHGPRFSILPMLAPFLIGGVLFAVTGSAESLIFVALSPMMMLANLIEGRMSAAKGNKGSMAAFHRELADLDGAAGAAREAEWRARNAEHPATGYCLAAAARRSPLLWSRRPGAPLFLDIRVGAATLESRLRFETQRNRRAAEAARTALDELVARYRAISDVPFALSLAEHGSIGIAGEPAAAVDVTRAALCQLATLHSPAELVLAAFCGSRSAQDWDWLKWLPHTSSAHTPLAGPHLVAGPESVFLLGQLEELVRSRLAGSKGAAPSAGAAGAADGSGGVADTGAAVLVLIDGRAAADRARLVELSRIGAAAGVYCVWLAQRAEHLPAACTAYIDVRGDRTASVGDIMTGTSTASVAADAVDAATAADFARIMAPLTDAGAVIADDSDLPRSVSWLELNDPRIADDPAAIVERWQESSSIITGPAAPPNGPRRPGTLRAIVGTAAGGPHALDLRLHGPHALLGGTTGAGKSELLQTWILAMAAAHSPQRVTFLLVDYKGGSAFRECVDLPHTVGLVTDLSPHMVRRALVSLGAELTYREHLFAAKKVKDLAELEKTGDPETPPSLVIVVDEFAALVAEVPQFVEGVVNVAQRGRSLGLHLILATQRPAGVIKDNLRANTNLRLALRMADEGDSTDVLGSPDAARFDPALPGRAVSKTGPGRLVPFQAGYVGGWTGSGGHDPDVSIEELVIGVGRTWPAREKAASAAAEQGPTDIVRITSTIRRASELAGMQPPRRPWLDELAQAYDLARLPTPRRDDELVFGVVDEPGQQRQSVVAFYPDREGNLAIFGTGGAGKSTALRSLAIAAGLTARGGPCQVYCLDFSSRGLDMLADLPHVGAVISGDEGDRMRRLLRTLLATADDRSRRYAAVRAGTISEYRRLAGAQDEPRILILLDGFAAFRQQYESLDGGRWFDALANLAADGRALGIHLILTADRPASLPSRLSSRVQRRLVMRLADDNDYAFAGGEPGVLTPGSPPGRGLLGRAELQVAVFGGATGSTAQSRAITQLAATMRRQRVPDAPRVEQLPEVVRLSDLPAMAEGRPAIGVADDTLGPVGIRPEGVFLISGPPASGRTTAVATAIIALDRAAPGIAPVLFGGKRSPLAGLGIWRQVATDPAEVAEAAAKLDQAVAASGERGQRYAVVIESVTEFLSSPADAPLTAMIKTLTRFGHVVIAEAETSALGGAWALLNAVKSARTGLALQPEQGDGLLVYKTDFPKSRRGEFPPGRGLLVEGGRARLLQVALPE